MSNQQREIGYKHEAERTDVCQELMTRGYTFDQAIYYSRVILLLKYVAA